VIKKTAIVIDIKERKKEDLALFIALKDSRIQNEIMAALENNYAG